VEKKKKNCAWIEIPKSEQSFKQTMKRSKTSYQIGHFLLMKAEEAKKKPAKLVSEREKERL
jgi:hypothetical protein